MIVNEKMILATVLGGVFYGGVVFAVCLLIVPDMALLLALLSGALFTLFIHIALTISVKQRNKKYSAFEKEIKSPVFFKVNGNFNLGNKVINGNIYFCEKGIVIFSLDRKPYACDEVPKSEIERYEFDDVHMNIYTTNGQAFFITVPNVKDIVSNLKNIGWIQ